MIASRTPAAQRAALSIRPQYPQIRAYSIPGPSSRRSLRRPLLAVLLGSSAAAAAYVFLYPTSSRGPARHLDPYRFHPLTVTSSVPLTPTTRLVTLRLPASSLPPFSSPQWPEGAIQHVYVKHPQLQIERAYTPLRTIRFNGEQEVELVVKRYEDSETSKWITGRPVGEELEIRGPVRTWDVREAQEKGVEEIVFVAGGTGITPAYQLLISLLSSTPSSKSTSSQPPHVTLLYASSTRADALLHDQLRALATQHPDQLTLRSFADRASTPSLSALAPSSGDFTVSRISRSHIAEALGIHEREQGWWSRLWGSKARKPLGEVTEAGRRKKRVVLVCGPDAMVNAVAGPMGRNLTQGPVGGVLKELGLTEDEVWKL